MDFSHVGISSEEWHAFKAAFLSTTLHVGCIVTNTNSKGPETKEVRGIETPQLCIPPQTPVTIAR